MKAVLHYAVGPKFRAALGALEGEIHVAVVEERDHAAFTREIEDADVLLHVLEPVTSTMLAAAPRLRLIQKFGVGVDTIDLNTCRARGVAVCNMPGANTRAVAEMTLALMLATLRRIVLLNAATRAGRGWSLPAEALDGLGEIGGKVVGLVGYGAVPRRLMPVLRALDAQPIVWSRRETEKDVETALLDDLLSRADIVSLHVPATAETTRLINGPRIMRMKRGAILINTARGALIDEEALVHALTTGHLAAAGLDVFAGEPLDEKHPLLALQNIVVTPHVAWRTDETLERGMAVAVENCRRLAAGAELLHRVL